ncbi:virion structural protein [Microcystis phage Mel-JY01]
MYKDYQNKGKNSNVLQYEIGKTFINITFDGIIAYTYSYKKPGENHVKEMKKLAKLGKGLRSYIHKNVNSNYEKKEPIKR